MNKLEIETLTLLTRWITIVEKRRMNESLCGYPPQYGGDLEVLNDSVALFQRLKTEMENHVPD